MTTAATAWILIAVALIAANLPWLSERLLFVFRPKDGQKRAWQRWLEWLILYGVVGAVALGLEKKATGEIYHQSWEFYTVTLCLFLVFALPGFLYRHDLRHHLARQ